MHSASAVTTDTMCLTSLHVRCQGILGGCVRKQLGALSGEVAAAQHKYECLCHTLKVNETERAEKGSCKALKSPMVFHFFYDCGVT